MTVLKYKQFVNEGLNEKANYTMAQIDKWLKKNAIKATGGGVWGPGYDYELKDGKPGTKVAIMDLGMKVNIGDKIERTISFANFQREYMNESSFSSEEQRVLSGSELMSTLMKTFEEAMKNPKAKEQFGAELQSTPDKAKVKDMADNFIPEKIEELIGIANSMKNGELDPLVMGMKMTGAQGAKHFEYGIKVLEWGMKFINKNIS